MELLVAYQKDPAGHNIAKFNIGTELRMLFGNTIRKNICDELF